MDNPEVTNFTSIDTHVGEKFDIILKKRGTAGYTWIPSFDERSMELICNEPVSSDAKKTIGSSALQRLKFRAKKPGETSIKLTYKRPWENDVVEEKNIKINASK